MATLPAVTAQTNSGSHDLAAEARWLGPDLLVGIWGGPAPHIGAVAMAQPRPSLADPRRTSATASVFTYVGHKEDRLAQAAAEFLAAGLDCKVVVAVGCHWEGLDAAGIAQVRQNARKLSALLLSRLQAQREP